jgi:hypothetical protein
MPTPDANPPQDSGMLQLRPARPWLLTAVGALAAGLSTGFLSADSCFATLKAILLGAIIGRIVEAFAGSERLRWWRAHLRLRILVVAVLGLALALFFRLDQSAAFEAAFGVRPPPGITNLTMERHYFGGPGDAFTLIRFHTDSATMEQLLVQAGLKEDQNASWLLAEHADWSTFWKRIFLNLPGRYGGSAWRDVAPIAAPKVYKDERGPSGQVRLLWDPATGQVYALHCIG